MCQAERESDPVMPCLGCLAETLKLSTLLGNSARLPAVLGQYFLRYCVAHATEKGYVSYISDRIVSTTGEVLAW